MSVNVRRVLLMSEEPLALDERRKQIRRVDLFRIGDSRSKDRSQISALGLRVFHFQVSVDVKVVAGRVRDVEAERGSVRVALRLLQLADDFDRSRRGVFPV